ncbi:hypothetical protein [Pseudoxanthomonas sp. UTMC 1351]|uniref:hypothetical protein n=1 Tax=Pseudoxanthomonas sp. UTMC 1351 TaxID=2695853 RepID=UPI0034CD7AFF
MPGISARGSIVFTVGNGKLIERFAVIYPGSVERNGCSSAMLRLPCALVFANKEDSRL